MASHEQTVNDCLELYRSGREGDAFQRLVDLGPQLADSLITACEENHGDEDLQAFILTVIGEYRDPSKLCYLRHLLRRQEVVIWKASLDGLVKAGTREALDDIEFVLDSVEDSGKRAWIEEVLIGMKESLGPE